MLLARALALAVVTALVVAAGAAADPPWSAPAPVDGVASTTALLTTQIGGRLLVGGSSDRSLAAPTVVAHVQADGSTTHRQALDIAYGQAATFARAGVVVAGSRPALSSAAAAKAPVVVALGSVRGLHGVGTPRALPGTAGQWVAAVGGHPAGGTVAVLTAAMYGPGTARQLWIRRGGTFRRALTFAAGTRARGAAVAVGPRGDVLVAWQAHGEIRARHVGPTGRVGAAHRLGAGVQSALQARVDDDGRLEVAWCSQQVGEGDAETPAVAAYASAAPGRGFTRAHILGGSSLQGTGTAVMQPGVRLVATGASTSSVAWTQYDGARFRVAVADVRAGAVGAAQIVSPAGEDAVLGDLASSPAGGTLVVWVTNTHGTDPSGPQQVAAASRPPGAAAFEAPVLVSEPVGAPGPAAAATSVPTAPSAAVDRREGHRLVAWTTLDQHTKVALAPGPGG